MPQLLLVLMVLDESVDRVAEDDADHEDDEVVEGTLASEHCPLFRKRKAKLERETGEMQFKFLTYFLHWPLAQTFNCLVRCLTVSFVFRLRLD